MSERQDKPFIITIDGPAGAGKSTLAKKLAAHVGAIYLDTGSMYRAATLKIVEERVDIHDEQAVHQALCSTEIQFIKYDEILMDNRNVESLIRSRAIDKTVSVISSYSDVRKKMVGLQRDFARTHKTVVEGRDVGSVVFPKADVKFFLTADLNERAVRRQKELKAKGVGAVYEDIRKEIRERDRLDESREHSPLKVPDGAFVVDTTHLGIEDVLKALTGKTIEVLNL